MAGPEKIRTVITGVGVVSPVGIGVDRFWSSLIEGRTGIGYLTAFSADELPSRLAAEVTDFEPTNYLRDRKFLKVMSREVQLGVSSASLAMQDSVLSPGLIDPTRLGVVYGAGRMSTSPQEIVDAVSGLDVLDDDEYYTRWGEDSVGKITPLWLLRQLPNMPACHISIDHDARGPNNTITSRDSSALLALAEAVRVIERNAADAMIVGACGSNISAVDIAKLSLYENLSRRKEHPELACRPFDLDRDGTVVGEGAASFVVERYEHAIARGAEIYAEVVGFGSGSDGKGYNNGSGGRGIVHSIRAALRRAEIQPTDIGHINAHGKSTQRDDLVEARAYHAVFGSYAKTIPVVALKSFFGNFDAGSGAVELAGTLLSLKHGVIPPTLNYEYPDPRCQLNVTYGTASGLSGLTALSVNRTNVGQSAAAILRAL
ncbi:MAG TPA: beta-ketoacyl-[acyl-carrier-protein] synthase family protein [Planctomycetaceae bacterium]|nr:beta-ketoacyl-[acyl-carrier-protein] synthase family protein [Planctomycetaceae bacterium]